MFLLASSFEKLIKVSVSGIGINPLYCVSSLGYTWQCGWKYTRINFKTLQDKVLILFSENSTGGGISSVMGDRFVKSDENKKFSIKMPIIYMDGLWVNIYLMMNLNFIDMLI